MRCLFDRRVHSCDRVFRWLRSVDLQRIQAGFRRVEWEPIHTILMTKAVCLEEFTPA
jgi:hypothetical protein